MKLLINLQCTSTSIVYILILVKRHESTNLLLMAEIPRPTTGQGGLLNLVNTGDIFTDLNWWVLPGFLVAINPDPIMLPTSPPWLGQLAGYQLGWYHRADHWNTFGRVWVTQWSFSIVAGQPRRTPPRSYASSLGKRCLFCLTVQRRDLGFEFAESTGATCLGCD